jgi:hypothetical protein
MPETGVPTQIQLAKLPSFFVLVVDEFILSANPLGIVWAGLDGANENA